MSTISWVDLEHAEPFLLALDEAFSETCHVPRHSNAGRPAASLHRSQRVTTPVTGQIAQRYALVTNSR